ncbi:hypothetical protein Nepgr_027192 [Nepenthes gracilis]|uniref:Uncharacterized protein n=1 Tax=Nepenthes gracilis TaxID=150966 RepID=A0AAD3Y2V6_NEPGR|nr:hypothetical protein Nepgr_027192 [Nepenthes gracilis]
MALPYFITQHSGASHFPAIEHPHKCNIHQRHLEHTHHPSHWIHAPVRRHLEDIPAQQYKTDLSKKQGQLSWSSIKQQQPTAASYPSITCFMKTARGITLCNLQAGHGLMKKLQSIVCSSIQYQGNKGVSWVKATMLQHWVANTNFSTALTTPATPTATQLIFPF